MRQRTTSFFLEFFSSFLAFMLFKSANIAAAFVPNSFQYNRVDIISQGIRSSLLLRSTTSSLSESGTGSYGKSTESKGHILLLGGSGFLGSAIAKRALMEGYEVTSLSRRGKTQTSKDGKTSQEDVLEKVKFVQGDARDPDTVQKLLVSEKQMPFTAVVHSIGLLLDGKSGLGKYNQFVSGSGSTPDIQSTYDDITRKTAFHAIDALIQQTSKLKISNPPIPFVFISAAEAGWPEMPGGSFIEQNLAPDWLRRYLTAKRAVEDKLMSVDATRIRPIIFRPSLIFSLDRLASLAPVGAFFVGNKMGLPFVDRPVTVQALACAVVRSLEDTNVRGVQRYKEIDALCSK